MHSVESFDIIKEVVNIGIGEASFALSEMVESPVIIKMPDIHIVDSADIPRYFVEEIETISICISQTFHGRINGMLHLFYSKQCAISLLNMLLDENRAEASLTEAGIATLEEFGNIVLVSFISSISDMINGRLKFTIPLMTIDISDEYFQSLAEGLVGFDKSVIVKNEMTIKEKDVSGNLFMFLSFNDFELVVETLNKKMGRK
jgi:chemotaxis protein CheC